MATLRTALAAALKTENPTTILAEAVRSQSKAFNQPPFLNDDKHDRVRGKAKRFILDTFGKELGKDVITVMFDCNRTDSRDKIRYHNVQHVINCIWLLDKYIGRTDSFGHGFYIRVVMTLAFVFHDAYHSQGRDPDIVNITKANSKVLSLYDFIFDRAAKVVDVDARKLTTDVMTIISDSQYPYPDGDTRHVLSILFRIIDRSNCICPGWFTLIYQGLLAEIRVNNPSFTLYEFTKGQVLFITNLFNEVDKLDKATMAARQGEDAREYGVRQIDELIELDSYFGVDLTMLLSDLAKAAEDMKMVHAIQCTLEDEQSDQIAMSNVRESLK